MEEVQLLAKQGVSDYRVLCGQRKHLGAVKNSFNKSLGYEQPERSKGRCFLFSADMAQVVLREL